MSSESSDDIMSCGVCSQDSNANFSPSCSVNAPTLQFSNLCLIDHEGESRWQSQEDSDYDSDYNATSGKRKQRIQESETDVQPKKRKRDEEMESQEGDSECQVQSEKSDTYDDCEADNEEEEEELECEEESSAECDGACGQEQKLFRMEGEPVSEPPLFTSLIQPSTSGMKRKNVDRLVSPTLPKVKRSGSHLE